LGRPRTYWANGLFWAKPIGKDGSKQWAASATASSSYGANFYGYGAGNELAPLLGTGVTLHLDGNVVLTGKLLRVGTDFLSLETESQNVKKTIYVNRQKLIYVDPTVGAGRPL